MLYNEGRELKFDDLFLITNCYKLNETSKNNLQVIVLCYVI